MPYAVCEITENEDCIVVGKMIACLSDAEMMALGRIRGLRFQLLMASALGGLLDKLEPAFMKLAGSKLDRRLAELQGSNWTLQEEETNAVRCMRDP